MRKMTIFAALLLTAVTWGCSGDDKANDAQEVVGDVGDMAADAVDQMKAQFENQLGGFDEQFSALTSTAKKLDNPELNSYVETIGAKLTDAKKTMADALAGQGIDMTTIRNMMTSIVAELTGLFNAANDKVKSLGS